MDFFAPEDRDRVRDTILAWARDDERVVAGARVGSFAAGTDDRWSDLDLTFGLSEDTAISDMLAAWTPRLEAEFGARHLFDLPSGAAVYRVFLLPGGLQVDVSFAPAHAFGARGPHFELLFGEAGTLPAATPPSAGHLFGLGAHHVLRARICVERGRLWQAAYWTGLARDHALELACTTRGLPIHHGRGYDDLPPEVLQTLESALVRRLEPEEILRALATTVDGLLTHAKAAGAGSATIAQELRALAPRPGSGPASPPLHR